MLADPERCRETIRALPMIADPAEIDPDDARPTAHVRTCLRCQAELVRYRTVLRMLRQLREEGVGVPDGAVVEVLEALTAAYSGRPPGRAARRLALVGGLTVAAVAGMATATVAAGRTRAARAAPAS